MANETLFVKCELYKSTQGTPITLDISQMIRVQEYDLFIPYVDSDYITNLTTGNLTTLNIINSKYFDLIENIPDITLASAWSSYISANTDITPTSFIQSYFPRTFPIITADEIGYYYYLRCVDNGHFIYNNKINISGGGASCFVWDESGNRLHASTTGQYGGFAGGPQSNSNYINVLLYSRFDNGVFTDVSVVAIRQTASTGEQLNLGGYDKHSINNAGTTLLHAVTTFLDGVTPIPYDATPDPYADGGTSTTGGGNGTFDFSSEPIDFPSLPSIGAYNTGFIDIYTPSQSQLQQLAAYMWSGGFDLDAFRRIVADPIDAIMGLSILPVSIPSESATLTVGNISTGLSMPRATTQFVVVDCGTLTVDNKWGAYLDYDPYSKTEIYLPYIGTHAISTDDIMGKTIQVKYYIDIVSGACVALIKCADSVLYSFVGSCSVACPVTNGQYGNVVTSALQIATSIGSMVATGGMSAAQGINDIASAAINTIKPQIEKSGSLGGSGGLLGIQKPYLILTVPRLCTPENQNGIIGYPAYITQTLGDLEGYTVIDDIHITGIAATGDEIAEIENLLKGGVIL